MVHYKLLSNILINKIVFEYNRCSIKFIYLWERYISLMDFVTNELECGSRCQSSLISCSDHILQVDLGSQPNSLCQKNLIIYQEN